MYGQVTTTTVGTEYFHHPKKILHAPPPGPLVTSPLPHLLATAGLISAPVVLANSRMSYKRNRTVPLALLLHVEITFNLLNVLLNAPLRAGFPSFPQVENLIFHFYLTQPLTHAGISSDVALIVMFRLPGNYQLSVKSSQQCESTQDEGGPWSALAHTCIQRAAWEVGGSSNPDLPRYPCKPQGHPLQALSMMMIIGSTIGVAAAVNFS